MIDPARTQVNEITYLGESVEGKNSFCGRFVFGNRFGFFRLERMEIQIENYGTDLYRKMVFFCFEEYGKLGNPFELHSRKVETRLLRVFALSGHVSKGNYRYVRCGQGARRGWKESDSGVY